MKIITENWRKFVSEGEWRSHPAGGKMSTSSLEEMAEMLLSDDRATATAPRDAGPPEMWAPKLAKLLKGKHNRYSNLFVASSRAIVDDPQGDGSNPGKAIDTYTVGPARALRNDGLQPIKRLKRY